MFTRRECFSILDLPIGSTMETVRKQYKKLALLRHPDKSGDADKFRELNSAYEQLQKGEYKDERPQKKYGHAYPMRQKNKVISKTFKLSMFEAYCGVDKKISITTMDRCGRCVSKCQHCNGAGITIQTYTKMTGTQTYVSTTRKTCEVCHGKRYLKVLQSCLHCKNGNVEKSEVAGICILPRTRPGFYKSFESVVDGHDLRVSVEISDKEFMFDNGNLCKTIDVSFIDSIFGVRVSFTHPSGENMTVDTASFNQIVHDGHELRVANKGFDDNKCLIIRFRVKYPTGVEFNDKKEMCKSMLQSQLRT